MNYSVKWTDDASADLWELWSSPVGRYLLTEAADFVVQLLERNPRHGKYEVVDEFGIAIHGPIGVDFWIDEANVHVYVTAAWPASEDM